MDYSGKVTGRRESARFCRIDEIVATAAMVASSSSPIAVVEFVRLRPYIRAPEAMYVNLCFKRKNGVSNHLKEATASKNVIARAQNK